MYEKPNYRQTKLAINTSVEGETLEMKMERVVNNKEPITDGAPLIYTERKDGVKRSTNIRTDRWEVAIEATDKIARSYKARREERLKSAEAQKDEKLDVGEAKNTNGTTI